MNAKQLKSLAEDYKQFAFTLLAVSAFLYIGSVLPNQELNIEKKNLLLFVDCLFIAASFLCVKRSLHYKKQLEKAEDE
ncbi:YrhC family protein [Bacillus gobiensis]|uniref:YrhC family protein n=1 Tax=Bacillus gobiensis TaxID=1441095 RepID=UPI003D20CF86